jgi:hypothetical protein
MAKLLGGQGRTGVLAAALRQGPPSRLELFDRGTHERKDIGLQDRIL